MDLVMADPRDADAVPGSLSTAQVEKLVVGAINRTLDALVTAGAGEGRYIRSDSVERVRLQVPRLVRDALVVASRFSGRT